MTDCDIRPLGTLQEMQSAVALQRSYWGDDPEAVVPGHMLFTLAQHGGHVLSAQERAGGRMVAILVGLPGTDIVAAPLQPTDSTSCPSAWWCTPTGATGVWRCG